ncbi:Adenylate and Guanylate cyclase catalytic domain containing protein [Trichomonas vaginalis G3]|uniref:Adenylate and Guanylate cyclase catalytic domain containing protein n=1 Tax=Trichomonas vaginalis (strain ATCC PRA-98 / G3) TaxID=412133 RepID=A2FKW6_TRIV3|nr:guanylate cyclase protein [Trichomonas vaginalis G3]EAX94450.1 Adenylate and Guanylate cyclase catalytic domain containing protein [Trichomonas vaginalis G3]KAI5528609.1 guanylate cyclase protein [Trichomonas vaginalis G3]|eukprot:XP_001307380.1 Adenylate and Guanylate cyclase catalytic domain containing protein [Trichomonas vaginalis G3]
MSSFWTTHNNANVDKIQKWADIILLFIKKPYDTKEAFIKEMIFFALCMISISLIVLQLLYYKLHRRFIRFLLSPIQGYDLLGSLGILSSSMTIGENFNKITLHETDVYLVISTIVAVFNIIYEISYHTLSMKLYSKNVALTNVPFLNFDPSINWEVIVVNSICIILTYIFQYFADWAYLLVIWPHFGFFLYFVSLTFKIGFIVDISNALMFSITLTAVLLDIVTFIVHFANNINHNVPFIIAVVFFLINPIIGIIFFSIREKKIIKELSDETDSVRENRKDYYDSLKIAKSVGHATMYLTVGITHACPMLYDFSLIEYLFSSKISDEFLPFLIQIVNFFPEETRLLNRLTMALTSKKGLPYDQRFLIFEIYKVKTLRQFSASADSNFKLAEMKSLSRQLEAEIKEVLDSNRKIKFSYFEYLSIKTKRTDAIWKEALTTYPNSSKFCEEYCRFLIECKTDYIEGIKIKYRENMIEMGRSYSVDFSFRSLVKLFPKYLTNDILDLKGRVIRKRMNLSRSRNSSSANFGSSSSSNIAHSQNSSEIDDSLQESIGKKSFHLAKQRIALHRALVNKYPKSLKCIIPLAIVILIIVSILVLFIFFYARSQMIAATESMNLLDAMSKTRFYIAINDMQIILRMCNDRNNFGRYSSIIKALDRECESEDVIFESEKDYLVQSFPNLHNAMNEFTNLINDIASMANQGMNVFNIASHLLTNKFMLYTCYGGYPVYYVNETITTMVTVFFAHQSFIITKINSNISDMYSYHQFCELLSNLKMFYTYIPEVFTDFCNFQIDQGSAVKDKFSTIGIVIPIIIALIFFLPILTLHLLIKKSVNEITEILFSLDTKTRQDAKEMIYYSDDNENLKQTENHHQSFISVCYIFVILFISLIIVVLAVLMCMIIINSINHVIDLNRWDQLATLRLSLTAEVMNTLTFGLTLHDNPGLTRISTKEQAAEMIYVLAMNLKSSNEKLLLGTDDVSPCSGFDEILDKENFQDESINSDNLELHEIYMHGSINSQLKILLDNIKTIVEELYISPTLSNDAYSTNVHLLSHHLSKKLMKVTDRLKELSHIEYNDMSADLAYLLIPCFILVILYAIVIVVYYNIMKLTYEGAISILKRINPLHLINNKLFIQKFMMKQTTNTNEIQKTVSGSIIHNFDDVVLCTNVYGVIDIVNTSATSILGYSLDQLLGQNATSFLVQADEEKIVTQVDNMRNNRSSSNVFVEDVAVLTDTNQLVPCKLTLLGIKNNNDELKSFVFILHDQSQLAKQQEEAEKAKATSEKLLYQILPRDIVIRLNRDETDITFTVNSSTICFIDIVKFSEYSSHLSPQEIMYNLSYFFGTIDTISSKFNLLTKIKVIGDIYMCASGLFDDSNEHAEQMILFANEFVRELDEINIKLDCNLSVRIGVNSGGPILGCVLGKEKPVFDIIGDPINVASRLQSTSPPNCIHMSQGTYDMVSNLNFDIKPRGEVYLKGKGKTNTYLMNPLQTLMAQNSQLDGNPLSIAGSQIRLVSQLSPIQSELMFQKQV